jgi:hypothetical protein
MRDETTRDETTRDEMTWLSFCLGALSMLFHSILYSFISSFFSWYVVSLLLVGCGTILWFFWDNVKKRRRPNKKEM